MVAGVAGGESKGRAAETGGMLLRCVMAAAAVLLAVCMLAGAQGCSGQAAQEDFLVVDMGEDGYATMAGDMGASPAGKTTFTFRVAEGALDQHRESSGADASATVESMLTAWSNALSRVTLDGRELERKSFDEWKSELSDPASDGEKLGYYDVCVLSESVQVVLPVALFDVEDQEIDSKMLSMEAEGFPTVASEVRFRNQGATSLVIRVLDRSAEAGGEVAYECTLTDEQIKSLPVQTGYSSSSNCGMAGIRSFYAEGVYLLDVLEAAGVTFGPGMSVQMRTTDFSTTNDGNGGQENAYYAQGLSTYEEIIGTERYYYPAVWDDETTYEELGGATVYELLAADKDVWKGDDAQAAALRRIIGQSKVKLEGPLLAWALNQGVVAWGGTDPTTQTFGSHAFNPYTAYEQYNLLFGMIANEDGSLADENTTFKQSGMVFGIDVLDPTGTAVQGA